MAKKGGVTEYIFYTHTYDKQNAKLYKVNLCCTMTLTVLFTEFLLFLTYYSLPVVCKSANSLYIINKYMVFPSYNVYMYRELSKMHRPRNNNAVYSLLRDINFNITSDANLFHYKMV